MKYRRLFTDLSSWWLASWTRSQRGVALPVSILALMLITVLGLALTTTAIISTTTSSNDKQASEVLYRVRMPALLFKSSAVIRTR